MSALESTEQNQSKSTVTEQKRRLRISGLLLLLFTLVLVTLILFSGILIFRQVQALETNQQVIESIINANVRSLGQTQRELLRLTILLEQGENDPEIIELHRAFVAQRMNEATLSYQLQTLGTEELLATSRILSSRWEMEVEPLIREITESPDDDDRAVRAEAVTIMQELELGFNQLVAQGEINRKQQAGIINDATVDILSSERLLLSGLGIAMTLFLTFMGVTAFYYYRFDHQRSENAARLLALNMEMRKLSQVASRTNNMVLITDAAGRVEWVNDAFVNQTGFSEEDAHGQLPVTLFKGPETDPQAVKVLIQAVLNGEGFEDELLIYTKAGAKLWAAVEVRPVLSESNQLINFTALVIDLTEQKEKAHTIAANSQLLDVINQVQHEFILTNTPGTMFEKLLDSLLALTESEFGFIGEVLQTATGKPYLKTHAITNIAWSEDTRKMYEQQAASGMEFYNLETLFGAALKSQKPVIANEPATDPRSGGMPDGHPPMTAFLGIPFFNATLEMVGLIGIANKPSGYNEALVNFLEPFLATCGNLIEAYRNEKRRQNAEDSLFALNAELELRSKEVIEQRDFALQIMNNMGQGLTVVDENQCFTFVNPAFAAMIKVEPESLIGLTPDVFTVPDDLFSLSAANTARRQGQISTYETRLKCSDGSNVSAFITGVPRYRNGEFLGSIAVITDLTEQKRVVAALRESEEEARKLSQVASRTNNMVIITDASGTIEWVNNAFCQVTLYSLDEAVGQRPGTLLQGPDSDPATINLMRTQIADGQGFKCDIVNYAKDGRRYWVNIEVQPVYDEDTILTHFIAVETDITDRRQAEQQLRLAKETAEQAALAKAAFLASMSHEIRTPLNAVIGLNSLLLNTDLDEKQRRFATTARNSGSLLLMLINNVLDFSALESGRVELEQRQFNVKRSVAELIDLLRSQAAGKELQIDHTIDAAVPEILIGDETRLQQILLNLIGNSIKFTPQGQVHLELALKKAEEAKLVLEFKIHDTGIGISPDRQNLLFQPFSQIDASTARRYGGSGLGLAISKMIVTMMGGEIELESTVGVGSTFTFTVVMAAVPPGIPTVLGETEEGDPEMGHRWPLRILLVEDDPVNQLVAQQMLATIGYDVAVANNGVEAIEALKQESFDVIFMDIDMPVMDGIKATRQIRAMKTAGKSPQIVAMTASALEGDRERFIAAGMDDYVSKPIDIVTLTTVLRQLVENVNGQKVRPAPQDAGEDSMSAAIDIAEFTRRIGPGQEALLFKVVDLFLTESPALLSDLGTAIESGHVEAVGQLTHRLKGSAAGAAATRFAEIAYQLEERTKGDLLEGAASLLAQLRAEAERIEEWRAAQSITRIS